jgi:hypothetical protein
MIQIINLIRVVKIDLKFLCTRFKICKKTIVWYYVINSVGSVNWIETESKFAQKN